MLRSTRTPIVAIQALASLVLFAFAFEAGSASQAGSASTAQHEHSDLTSSLARLELDGVRKWPTDAPLRSGMETIRGQLAGLTAALRAGSGSTEEYAGLAAAIESEVAEIVKRCKLPPAADAQLHYVIAELMTHTAALKARSSPTARADALRSLSIAVNAYGEHFEHPGWAPLPN